VLVECVTDIGVVAPSDRGQIIEMLRDNLGHAFARKSKVRKSNMMVSKEGPARAQGVCDCLRESFHGACGISTQDEPETLGG